LWVFDSSLLDFGLIKLLYGVCRMSILMLVAVYVGA